MVFESLVADLLNRYLGKYIQNLNTENLDVGIFSGQVELSHLQLKPEALFELDLPIEVKAGYVGKIKVNIPWTSLYTLPVIATLDDVYILAGPVSDRKYEGAEQEKAFLNAIKRQKLAKLENPSLGNEKEDDPGFFDKLASTIINNIQVFVKNIHIRYEDKVTNPDHPFACGITIKSLSAETTNKQWQVTHIDANAPMIHKVVSLDGLSVYWNPYLPEQSLVKLKLHTDAWRNLLKNSIESHSIMNEDFDFIVKPVSAVMKVILNKSDEFSLPKILVDFLLKDFDVMISRQQFLNILSLAESFKMMKVNELYRKYRPNVPLRGNAKMWWRYAFTAYVENFYRPYTWKHIKEHRNLYRKYKDAFKKYLEDRSDQKVRSSLLQMEDNLDLTNIVLAREEAKLQYLHEAPERAKRKKKESWFAGWFSSDDEEEIDIAPDKNRDWFSKLTPEEKKQFYEGIGYDENANVVDRPADYIEHKVNVHLKSCVLTLVNYGKEVLRMSVTNLISALENRPQSNGMRVTGKTESFIVEGASIEHDLVPIITSDIGVYAPSQLSEVFSVDVNINPPNKEADIAAKLCVQPVEIVYDEHSVNEVIAFFQVPHKIVDDVKSVAIKKLKTLQEFSRAGLQYAIDNHKMIDLSVDMRSPYIVIPEYGTLHRGGNVLVIDLGKLKVQSELQPKNQSLENATMTEIESRLYDKFNLTVTDVKLLLADSGDDWHTAQTQPESEYHILPNVELKMSLFNSIKPEYKQLPRQKVQASLPTLKVNVSDHKIIMLAMFFRNIPIPNSESMPALIEDTVDAPVESGVLGIMDMKQCQKDADFSTLKGIACKVNRNHVRKKKLDSADGAVMQPARKVSRKKKKLTKEKKEYFYSASDHSDEDVEDWAKPLNLEVVDDSKSKNNRVKILLRFTLVEVVIQIAKHSNARRDVPYLMFRINRVNADIAVTEFGLATNLSLGGLELVDKIHTGSSGEYLEMLSSKADSHLISFMYRKVDPVCPDFQQIYRSIEQGIVVDFSTLDITLDKVAIVYLYSFATDLQESIAQGMSRSVNTPISTPGSLLETSKSIASIPQELIKKYDEPDLSMPIGSVKLCFVAKLKNVSVHLKTMDEQLADIHMQGLEAKVTVRRNKTVLYSRLKTILINDATVGTLYPDILRVDTGTVFDMKLILYNKEGMKPEKRNEALDYSVRARVGRLEGVFLYKFISELMSFIRPLTKLTSRKNAYIQAASDAVKNQMTVIQEEGKKIVLNINVLAPTIWMPQNSKSHTMLVIELGDLSLKNYFDFIDQSDGKRQGWETYNMHINSIQVHRSVLVSLNSVTHCHNIIDPINMRFVMKRALKPLYTTEAQYQVDGKLDIIQMNVSQKDVQVGVSIFTENIKEAKPKMRTAEAIDNSTQGREVLPHPEIDVDVMPTPTTAEPKPLLTAQLAKVSFVMEGMKLKLLNESNTNTPDSCGMLNSLSLFEVGEIVVKAAVDTDKAMQVQLTLKTIALVDDRSDSDLAVKRIFQYVADKKQTKANDVVLPMVSFMFQRAVNGAMTVNLDVEKFRINMSLAYLLTLMGFAKSLSEIGSAFDKTEKPRSLPVQTIANKDTPAATPTAMTGINTPPPPLVINARLKESEVLFFFEPANKNSKILVLKVNAEVGYSREDGDIRLAAKVNDLQIFSCVFGKRSTTAFIVLHPCNIHFKRSVATDTDMVVMDAQIPDIKVNITPSILHMVKEVIAIVKEELALHKKPEIIVTEDKEPDTDLWSTKTISLKKWLSMPLDEEICHSVSFNQTQVSSETFNFSMKKILLTFEVETADTHMPVVTVKSSIAGHFDDRTQLNSEIQLEVCYFNEKLNVWEPLLEPVMEEETEYRPWEVTVKMIKGPSHPIRCVYNTMTMDGLDDVDGDINVLMCKAKAKVQNSDSETDSENEMTVIQPKTEKIRMRHGSDRSYDLDRVLDTIEGPETAENVKPIDSDDVDGPDEEEQCTYLVVDSKDKLLLNVTPEGIDVITDVMKSLTKDPREYMSSYVKKPSFEIYNELDLNAKVRLPSDVTAYKKNLHRVEVENDCLEEDEDKIDDVDSKCVDEDDETDGDMSFLSKALALVGTKAISSAAFVYEEKSFKSPQKENEGMHLHLDGFQALEHLTLKRAGKYMVALSPQKHETDYCIVYNVDAVHGRKVVTIRSPLQLDNQLTMAVDIFCKTEEVTRLGETSTATNAEEYTKIATVEAGEKYAIPLFIAYHCRLYVGPAGIGYQRSFNGISWQDLSALKDKSKFFLCLPEQGEQKAFSYKVSLAKGIPTDQFEDLPKMIPNYTIQLHPPVILHNYLPYDIQFALEGSDPSSLTHGEMTPLYTADLHKTQKLQIQLNEYLGLDWSGNLEVTSEMDEFKVVSMELDAAHDTSNVNQQLSLNVHTNNIISMHLYVYSPYWIVNKSGWPIQLRGSGSDALFENESLSEPILFRYKKYKRKKAKIRVYNSKWSHSFSLDTVGSSGVVICKDKERNRKYQFHLYVQMSKLKLTKIVTIAPYFLMVNTTDQPLRFMEVNTEADLWLDLQPNEVAPFYPVTEDMFVTVKYAQSKANFHSETFPIKMSHSSVLRMENGTALVVEVAGGVETSVTVTFQKYDHGDAPVRVENLCEDVFIKFHQKNQSQVSLLPPCQSILYTWDNPTSERTLMWNVYGNKKRTSFPAFINKDGFGEERLSIQTISGTNDNTKESNHGYSSPDDDSEVDSGLESLANRTRTDKVVVYWASYLDGLQRVMLFTQDERVAKRAKRITAAEKASMALYLSLDSIGVSLINKLDEEVAFISLISSPALWDVEVNGKWKMLNMELASWLEDRYRTGTTQASLQDYIEADLKEMTMTKPFMGSIRRTFHPAVFFSYRKSEHNTAVHVKLHRLQIDNQLPDAYFTTVLYPTPIPHYILRKTGSKPFVELAFMRRQVPENSIDAFKYFQVLIQELSLKVDKGFLLSVYDIFSGLQEPKSESVQLRADLTIARRSLKEAAKIMVASRPQKILYEHLHLSPLKLNVSFSLSGRVHETDESSTFSENILEFFLNSIGVTFTEVKDVELRMAYFDRKGAVLSTSQLISEVKSHYISQTIQQLYVLILGLDVLGNPYGLVKDFTQGLGDFFYEPFMGSIKGPDEFADGITKGVLSLLGHTVGGAAGSVSLISGSIGRTLAVLTFDDDYKRRRRREMQQQPKDFPSGLLKGGKGFVMGVALGLSGVIVQPIKGVQEEGVEGFFKGIGKGLLGLITKPASGSFDMISMAFDGLRRAAEMGDHVVVRMRLPRYIHPQLGLRPYSMYQATGRRLLMNLNKGEYTLSDDYWAHASLTKEERSDVAVVTSKRILLLEKCRFWGDWDVEVDEPLEAIIGIPAVVDKKLIFKISKDKTSHSIFASDEREIESDDPEIVKWLQMKIQSAVQLLEQRKLMHMC